MEFKIENLSESEVQMILDTLGNQPYTQVYVLINKIQNQCNGQLTQNHEIK